MIALSNKSEKKWEKKKRKKSERNTMVVCSFTGLDLFINYCQEMD